MVFVYVVTLGTALSITTADAAGVQCCHPTQHTAAIGLAVVGRVAVACATLVLRGLAVGGAGAVLAGAVVATALAALVHLLCAAPLAGAVLLAVVGRVGVALAAFVYGCVAMGDASAISDGGNIDARCGQERASFAHCLARYSVPFIAGWLARLTNSQGSCAITLVAIGWGNTGVTRLGRKFAEV
jgi:hypothetical protein